MTELNFSSDTKYRKQWFTGLSFSHPAKMSLPLQIWLIERYSQPGEVVLDPMAGSGTILVACSLGRNVICVELEQKFVDMMKNNWTKIQERGSQLGYQMGQAVILQGDARNLEGLLADKIITSPPYEKTITQGGNTNVNKKKYGYQGKNIGYAKPIDSIISSPPYEEAMGDKHHSPRADKLAREKSNPVTYTDRVDSIITSPPYEEAHDQKIGGLTNTNRPDLISYSWVKTENKENIGNLKSDSYLSAMLQVYQECYKVLKPQGLMILVTKNFIRDKKEVRLDMDTIKLCEQAGFKFKERHYRKLQARSFWRTIYYRKYPNAPRLDREDILVLEKE